MATCPSYAEPVSSATAQALAVADRLHPPPAGAPDAAQYKEWQHFVLFDGDERALIANLSVSGDVQRGGGGEARVVLLSHGPEGWSGGVDVYRGEEARLTAGSPSLRVGPHRLDYRGGRYRLSAALRDGSLAVRAHLEPVGAPAMIWSDTPVGSGYVNWLIVPDLVATGRARAGGWRGSLSGWRGYHDHNWGRWWWGEDFGWQWGVAQGPDAAGDGSALTLVYDRTTDRAGQVVKEHTLTIWRGAELATVFTRGSLRARATGTFSREPVRRVPGVMGLLAQGTSSGVPREFEWEAHDGPDHLVARYEPASAIDVVVPSELGPGHVRLAEAVGTLTVQGRVLGEDLDFRTRGFFEFMGG